MSSSPLRDRQFKKAMDRAQRHVKGFAAKSQKELSNTTRAMNDLSGAAKRLAPILAAAGWRKSRAECCKHSC